MTISRILTIFFLSFLVFIIFFHPIDAITQDLGRHLLLGKIIVQTQTVPKTNLLSYTYPDYPLINTHWFSEVLFYLIEKVSGLFGLLFATSVTATAAFLIQLFYVKKYSVIPILFASLIYFRILLERTDLRPEIFSFFFLSIFIVLLYKFRSGFTRWIYILPFVELLWVNTHVYFPIGILVLSLFLIDYLITRPNKTKRKNTITLVVILIASIITTLLNPNTIDGALFPLNVFQNYGFEIEENHNVFAIWNLFQQKSTILYFFIAVPLLFLVLLITIKKTKPVDWFLTICFTVFAATFERNLSLFVFATFIPFTKSSDILYTKFFSHVQEHRNRKIILYLVAGFFIFWQTKDIVTFNTFGYKIPTGASKAVDYLQKNNIPGPIFNNFDIGSYLEYRLYPKEKVFVDGRPEAYPVSFFQQIYIPMQQDKTLFQQADKKYHFNIIFISHTDPTPWTQQFLRDVNASHSWKLVYLDPLVVIYIKNTLQNQQIKNFSIFNAAQLSPSKLTKDELIHLLLFYQNIGWTNEIKVADQKLLELDPKFCYALRDLAILLQNENDPAYVIYATKYQDSCQ